MQATTASFLTPSLLLTGLVISAPMLGACDHRAPATRPAAPPPATRPQAPPPAARPATPPPAARPPAPHTAPAGDAVAEREEPQTISETALPIDGCRLVLDSKIEFKPDHAIILPGSYPVLDAVVDALIAHPDWNIRIEGHIAYREEYYGRDLSKQRAKSVRKYLIAKGIDPERLAAQGFGHSRPLAPNKTHAGRALNRRIEFHLRDC